MLRLFGVTPPYRLVVVRQDRSAILQAILHSPDRWPAGSAVMLDRRLRERRTRTGPVAIERRCGPRRAAPDAMWHTHGFIVVHVAELPREAIRLDGVTGTARSAGCTA